jgi:integrase
MRTHLTEIAVRSLKPTEHQEKVWDTQTRGFGVRVNGVSKSWIVMYGEKRTLRTIGRYPDMSLADARREAKKVLVGDHAPEKSTPTIEEAFEEYERSYGAEHHGERTRYHTRRFFERYVFPRYRRKKPSELNFGGLEAILPASPSEANHLYRTVRAFLTWCVRKDYIPANPLAGKSLPHRERSRDRVLTTDELRALWTAATGQYGAIWKTLLLTGQRRSQILALERAWIADGLIEFPATVMKGKKPHLIPLGDFTKETLPNGQGKYVFPSSKGGHTKNVSEQKKEHDGEMKPYVLHDLRRTFASIHASIGTPIHVIERLLNHTTGSLSGVAGIYNRYSYFPEMEKACEAYESYIRSLLLDGHSQPEGRHDAPP